MSLMVIPNQEQRQRLTPLIERDIVRMYRELKNMVYIAKTWGFTPRTISKVIRRQLDKQEIWAIKQKIKDKLDGRYLSRNSREQYFRNSVKHLSSRGNSVEDISYILHITEEKVRLFLSTE